MMTKHKITIIQQDPPCPKCGGRTKLRVPRSENDAWLPFYGCTQYPDCNGAVRAMLHDEAQISFWEKPKTMDIWVWA